MQNGQFVKGQKPIFVHPRGSHPSPRTEFKPGMTPVNKVAVGTIRQRQHRGDGLRNWIKVAEPSVWLPLAVHIWQQNHGAISPGMVVHHVDENTLNDTITNLELVTRAWHMAHHRQQLTAAKLGVTLALKVIPCPRCQVLFEGKKLGSFCDHCAEESRTNAKRRYKERVHSARRC